jgi:hypothetical protein
LAWSGNLPHPQAQHSSLSKILLNTQVPWVDQDHATTFGVSGRPF